MLDAGLSPVSLRTSAAVAGAFIIGAYVLFGTPTTISGRRRGRKRDGIPGLANIGNSCFLNALVQGLASCQTFISWLSDKESHTGPPLVSALYTLLRVLNNEDGGEGDACAGEVLGALRGHGWVISSEEQDTHELFHVLTSTIDDELTTATSVPSLLDVTWLDVTGLSSLKEGVVLRADSWEHCALSLKKSTKDTSKGMGELTLTKTLDECAVSALNSRIVDSTSHEGSVIHSEKSSKSECEADVGEQNTEEIVEQNCDEVSFDSKNTEHDVVEGCEQNFDSIISGSKISELNKEWNDISLQDSTNAIEKNCDEYEIKLRSDSNVSSRFDWELCLRELSSLKQPSKNVDVNHISVRGEKQDSEDGRQLEGVISGGCQGQEAIWWRAHGDNQDIPFRGYLASQLQCTFCGHKNPAQWSSFESLSLSLPPGRWGDVSLTELLDAYVTPERVSDVSCDSCSRRAHSLVKTTFTKQLTIGKLPECLCFHIKRTVWLENGSAIKRRDHLTFPEYLVMDPYTYTTSITSNGGHNQVSIRNFRGSNPIAVIDNKYPLSTVFKEGVSSSNHVKWSLDHAARVRFEQFYRLQSVIVHVGDVFCGHFVTYRRGPVCSRNKDRWFYTSDLFVKEASLEDVQKANAYMIMYEKVM